MKLTGRVSDLMSRDVKTLRRNDSLSVGDDLLRQERIRHLPVVDDDDEEVVVGIVSQRDLFRGALARCLGYGEHAQDKLFQQLSVKEVMTNDVVCVAADTSIGEAARLMRDHQIGSVVVTEPESGRLLGILTEGDFVRAVAAAE